MKFQPLTRSEQTIVRELQQDGRTTKRALAAAVDLAPSTTLDRVRDLEDRGVITGYHADVDLGAMGRPMQAFVSVRVRPKTQDVVDRLIEHLWNLPQTLGIYVVSGEVDLMVHLGVADTDSLRTLVLSEIANAEGVVDETTSLIFEHRRKRVIEPA